MMNKAVDGVDTAADCRVARDEQIGSLRYRLTRRVHTLRLSGLRRARGCCGYHPRGMGGNASSVSPTVAVGMVCRWRATCSRPFAFGCLFSLLGLRYG